MSYSLLNSSRMSYRSAFALWATSRRKVDRSFARQWLLHGTSGLVWSILVVLLTSFNLFCSAHSLILDEMSQDRQALNTGIYYEAFASLNSVRIRTGIIYNASLPGNITDLDLVQMVRLRSGSLKRYGFQFNEIILPKGVEVVQTLPRVVLVYRRFKGYRYYDATLGNVFVAPVVGILVYNAGDITNYTDYVRPELTIVTTGLPIQVQLESSRNATLNRVTCVMYNNTINGTTMGAAKNLSALASCSWTTLGDYSLLAPTEKRSNNTWKIILGSVAGALLLLLLLALTVFLAVRYREKAKFANMESKSEQGETLHHTFIGGSRAPAAASTRTKPTLEDDYVS